MEALGEDTRVSKAYITEAYEVVYERGQLCFVLAVADRDV
jgi:hypothetical protein